jgi:curved DNA-binding protein CbpA
VGSDPFEVLGLGPDATLAEARAAYRRLAELFHPDRLRGLRQEVQAEGAQRMREATDAMRAIRARYDRPLVAPGRQRPSDTRASARPAKDAPPPSSDERQRRSTTRPARPTTPAHAENEPRRLRTPPSDAATETAAHLYHVQLRGLDGPGFQVNWGGRHAAATLAALRHAHTIEGPIRQFEWGSYEWVLDGAATRSLLWHVLEGEEWTRDPAEVVALAADLRDRCLPARRGHPGSEVELGPLLDLLDERGWYSVTAEVY